MSRLIYVPQFPAKMRYQEWWYKSFKKRFRDNFDELVILGEMYCENYDDPIACGSGMFSPIEEAIKLEVIQIEEYSQMNVKEDDIMFVSDISFPGLFLNMLYHKPIKNLFGYCHATSLNNYDYFSPVRKSKFKIELNHSKLFKEIFVGSLYHKNKLANNGIYNTKVLGVPYPSFELFMEPKKYDIISVSRPCIQKVNKKLEKMVERDFGKIHRQQNETWEQYYKFLSEAKVVLISSKEETFGYQVMETIENNSVPLCPRKFSYPELLRDDYLYDDYDELRIKIWQVLNYELQPPYSLKCLAICNLFYENLIMELKNV